MKLAFIPPTMHLGRYSPLTNWHMMLPQQLGSAPYGLHYMRLIREPDQFVIMDNGAAEAQPMSAAALARLARIYKPYELVLPDVLGDSEGTIKATMTFFGPEGSWLNHPADNFIQLGVVAQGENWEQACDTIMELDKRVVPFKTIYLPRLLLRGDKYARVKAATRLHKTFGDTLNIHLLGASSLWSTEVHAITETCPFVRSMDTSMPFVYAFNHTRVNSPLEVPHRDGEDYFNKILTPNQDRIAMANCNLMMGWANQL